MKISGIPIQLLDNRYLKLDASNDPVTGNLLVRPTVDSLTNCEEQDKDTNVILSVDSVNNRVGIGTASPLGKTHIKNSQNTATLGSEMITVANNRTFAGAGNWTGTNWTVGSGVYTHTAGANAASLANTYLSEAPVGGNYYKVVIKITTTVAGVLTIALGGRSYFNLAGSQPSQDVTSNTYTFMMKAVGNGPITLTPDAVWTGSVDNVSIKKITPISEPLITFETNAESIPSSEIRITDSTTQNMYFGKENGVTCVTSISTANVGIGFNSLYSVITGSSNVGIGTDALYQLTTGDLNIAIGNGAFSGLTIGSGNIALGGNSFWGNISGSYNIGIGTDSGSKNISGSNNTFIGYSAGFWQTGSDKLIIDNILRANAATELTNAIIYGVSAALPINQTLALNAVVSISDGLIVNEGGLSTCDTRIEGDTDANLLFVDARADKVGIGTTGPGARLEIIGGSAGSKSLIVRGNSSNDANIQEWQYNSGTVRASIANTGAFYTLGDVGIGVAVDTKYGLNLAKSVDGADTLTYRGLNFTLTDAPSTSNTHYVQGLAGYTYANPEAGVTNSGNIRGGIFGAYLTSDATQGTVTTVYGLSVGAGTLTGATGTITNLYGFDLSLAKASGSTITNAYGLYLADVNQGDTLNYAIVTNAGNIVFNEGGDASTDFRVEGDTATNLLFTDASADAVRINYTDLTGTTGKFLVNGNVGIGTTAPATHLELRATKDDNIRITSTKDASDWTTSDTIGGFEFYGSDLSGLGAGGKASMRAIQENGIYGNLFGLMFSTAGTNGNDTERMRITNTGNVGIGTIAFGTSATKVLGIGSGTAPTTAPADMAQMWVKDINAAAGYAGWHKRTETTNVVEIVPGVVIKATTGRTANPYEGFIEINTFDNLVAIYADADWRTLASGW